MKGYQLLQSFRLNIMLRVFILVILCTLFGMVLANYDWFFTPLVIGILIIIVTLNLIYYQESTNRRIVTFLTSLRQSNFTNLYALRQKGKSFEHLEILFQDINNSFLKINMEKESHYQYLQALNENIGVGIISYLETGKIQLYNTAAKKIFKKPILDKIGDLKTLTPGVYEKIKALQLTGGTVVIPATIGETVYNLSVTCRKFKAQDVPFYVVLFQDIKKALDEKESMSWQKLIRVLTHEIMNSATPIASLSEAVNRYIKNTDMRELSDEDIQDLHTSLSTIENRSKGMVKFVNNYKDYARELAIKKQRVAVGELVSGVKNLLQSEIEKYNIAITATISPASMMLSADPSLLEQVLINLIKNAIDVLAQHSEPQINIEVTQEDQTALITIMDNGPGIAPENLETIFVPFFTTKRTGSGVGLSLSKKIMHLHGGDIRVRSSSGGTVFTLTLPCEDGSSGLWYPVSNINHPES